MSRFFMINLYITLGSIFKYNNCNNTFTYINSAEQNHYNSTEDQTISSQQNNKMTKYNYIKEKKPKRIDSKSNFAFSEPFQR